MVARARRANCTGCSSSSWLTRVSDVRGDDISARGEYWAFRLTVRFLRGHEHGRSDHLGPFFGFLLEPPPVIRGRAAGDAAAQVGKPQLQFGVCQRGVNHLVEFVDYLWRRVFG